MQRKTNGVAQRGVQTTQCRERLFRCPTGSDRHSFMSLSTCNSMALVCVLRSWWIGTMSWMVVPSHLLQFYPRMANPGLSCSGKKYVRTVQGHAPTALPLPVSMLIGMD